MNINFLHLLPAICFGLNSAAVLAQQDVRILNNVNYMKVVNSSNAKFAATSNRLLAMGMFSANKNLALS